MGQLNKVSGDLTTAGARAGLARLGRPDDDETLEPVQIVLPGRY